MNKYFLLLFVACSGCTFDTATEKHQTDRNNVVHVRDHVKEIDTGDVLISRISWLCLANECIIVGDYHSVDNLIQIFDRKDFHHITGTVPKGQGPGELANMGRIGADEKNRRFYVLDHGKASLFCYELDSVLTNPKYQPSVKMKLGESEFPVDFQYLNDTLCYGVMMLPTGISGFNETVSKWNMNTGEIQTMKYTHPSIERKRVSAAMSLKHGLCVECYHHHDLFTLCNLDGELICNVYGSKWDDKKSNRFRYFNGVGFYQDKILISYAYGRDHTTVDAYSTTFLVFDLKGDYLKTIEVGYKITNFCIDEVNHRIVMLMDDEIQFGYLDLNGII